MVSARFAFPLHIASILFVATSACALTPCSAQPISASGYTFFMAGGPWVVSPGGRVSYCQAVVDGQSGAPRSTCRVIGSIGATLASSVVVSVDAFALWVVNHSVVNCTLILLSGTTPTGGCAPKMELDIVFLSGFE